MLVNPQGPYLPISLLSLSPPTTLPSSHLTPLPKSTISRDLLQLPSSISCQYTSGTFARRHMVSSAPAPLINPPLSYAERVKRAHSPKLVRNSPLDFPAVSTASGVSSTVSPRSNATAQLTKHLNSVEVVGRSRAGASDFPELPTEMSSQNAMKDHNEQTNNVHANPQNVPKIVPAVNVWAERMKEQVALTNVHQAQKLPPAIATCSDGAPPVSPRSRPIVIGTLSHPLDVPNTASSASTSRSSPSQITSLNGNDDDHDPFVVRLPPHLSRHSSSKSIPLVKESDDAAPSLEHRKPPSLTDNDDAEKSGKSESHADAYNSSDLSRKSTLFASTPFKHPTFITLLYNGF